MRIALPFHDRLNPGHIYAAADAGIDDTDDDTDAYGDDGDTTAGDDTSAATDDAPERAGEGGEAILRSRCGMAVCRMS